MDSGVLAIIVSLALAAIVLVATIIGVQRGRRGRFLVRGIGLALVPIGLLLTGVMHLLVNGLRSLGEFFGRSQLNAVMITGLVLLVLGLVLYFGGGIGARRGEGGLDPAQERLETRERRRKAKQDASGRQPSESGQAGQLEAGRSAARGAGAPAAQAPRAAAPKGRGRQAKGGLDADDAEIEALLKSRGIE